MHACHECGTNHPKWTGQCSGCGAWNSLVEEVVDDAAGRRRPPAVARRCPSSACSTTSTPCSASPSRRASASSTGCSAAASCPARSPCSAASRASARARCCCSSWPGGRAPRSTSAPRRARSRCGCAPSASARCGPSCGSPPRRSLDGVLAAIDRTAPEPRRRSTASRPSPTGALASAPGSVGQVRDCAQQLVVEAKRRGVAMVLVGHVTKDGSLAGPRVLEHVVDTVLSFEGERHHALRLLRAVKHRFGSTDELGLFEMTGHGLVGVPDPSKLFLSDRRRGLTGSVVVPVIEGHRPVLVEIQALTVPIPSGHAAAAQRPGARRRPPGPAARRARTSRPGAARRPGRLRLRRRGHAAHRAGHRPRRGPRRRQRPPPSWSCPTIWS